MMARTRRAPEARSAPRGAVRKNRGGAPWAERSRTGQVAYARAAPCKEEVMLGLRSKDEPLARCGIGLSAGGFAVCLAAVTLAAGSARAESSNAIPQFASANF